MLNTIIENIIKLKNPHFKLDDSLNAGIILELAWEKLWNQLRATRLLLAGKNPLKRFLGKNVRFFNMRNIQFGNWVQIEDGAYLSALGREPLTIGNNVRIGAYSRLIISTSFNNIGSYIKIGNNVGLGEFAYLGGAGGLEIGDDCIIGQYLSCHPENHNYDNPQELIRLQGVNRKGIYIGKNCWIGSKVTILDGVTIGENCIVAAGAVVTKSMPANSVIGGVPAKVIKKTNIDFFAGHRAPASTEKSVQF